MALKRAFFHWGKKGGKKVKKLEKKRIEHWQVISLYLVVYDIFAVNLSYLMALWFRFDCRFSLIPEVYLKAWIQFAPFYTVLCLAVFTVLKLYRSLWRFAGYSELLRVTAATVLTGFLHYVGITVFFKAMPISYITKELVEQISLLEPFGKGNTKPVFAQKNLGVLDHSIIGKNKNVVKLKLLDPQGISVEGIYFGEAEDFVNFIREKDSISVTYYPEINRFRGRESLQIIIQNYC